MVKQLAKLVKVRFVDDLTDRTRMGVLPHELFCFGWHAADAFMLHTTMPRHSLISPLS